MNEVQAKPSLWYWGEPATGYSIEECERILEEEQQQDSAYAMALSPWS